VQLYERLGFKRRLLSYFAVFRAAKGGGSEAQR
jgi:hypothetical protein